MTDEEKKEFEEFQQWKKEKAQKEEAKKRAEQLTQKKEETKLEIKKNVPQKESNTEDTPQKLRSSKQGNDNTTTFFGISIAIIVLIVITVLCVKSCSINNDKKAPVEIKMDSDSFSTVELNKKRAIEKAKKDSIEKAVQAKRDSIEKVIQAENKKIAEKLKPRLKFRYDDIKKITWVEPKNKPRYIDENFVYCYFLIVDGTPLNFRLCIQYTADDWLFIESYKFKVDNLVFDYTPNKIDRDSDTDIWEWSDEAVDVFHADMINAIVGAKHVKVLFIGQQYEKRRSLSNKELQGIKDIARYYKAIGGKIE